MREILDDVSAWLARGERVAVATVVEVTRSAPRQPGAKMAVCESGQIVGAVSGGCVEGAVIEVAEEVLRGEQPRLVHFGSDDDPCSIGLPCGGEISIWVEEFHPGRMVELASTGLRGAEVTLLQGELAGAKLIVEADGARSGTLGSAELDRSAEELAAELLWADRCERRGSLFIDVVAPAPRLIIVGAVDIAAALCTHARTCGWRSYVIDPRARFATPERFTDADEVIAAWPEPALTKLGGIDPATSIVVLTHDPKLDDAALLVALASPAGFIGAMGSRPAQAARRERLLAAGVEETDLDRISAPIGLDLGATSVAETALSIFAEVVAVRHNRSGGALRNAEGRIHVVPA
jgi:xanthine dehydrogenase accessory factor